MSSPDEGQDQELFPFNYNVDIEMLTIVLTKEVYLIPFHKARAAFNMVRQCMIDTNAFCATPLHDPASSVTPATSTQLLKRYQHLIVNHPSRDVPEQPVHHMQFEKRSRLLNQIFSKIIGSIYVRGVGRPPRKYVFDEELEIMLLEHVLQYKAHLRPRLELNNSFSNIRKSIILKYHFASDHTVPAPSSIMEGAPTVSQLIVRYQYLITSHVNPSIKLETDEERDPESDRKLSHLLDIIVRAIVTQALSGSDFLRKARRSSVELIENDIEHPVPRVKRRKSYPNVEHHVVEPLPLGNGSGSPSFSPSRPIVATGAKDVNGNSPVATSKAMEPRKFPHIRPGNDSTWRKTLEERRLAIEEDQHKRHWKLVELQEQSIKIDQQRVNLQEKALVMMQEEHKMFVQTLSSLTTVFSKVAQNLGIVDLKASLGDQDIEGKALPPSIDPMPLDTALGVTTSITNDETPMDIEPIIRESPIPTIERAAKELATKEPVTKESTTKEPATKEPAIKESTTKEPTTNEPTTKEPAIKESTTKEPAIKESTTKESTTKESTTKEPTTKEPAVKEPPIKEPATKEHATKKSATKEPTVKEPATNKPATRASTIEEPAIKPPATGELAGEKPLVESRQSEKETASMQGRSNTAIESVVKNERPARKKSLKEHPKEDKQAKGTEPGGDGEQAKDVNAMQISNIVDEGPITKSSKV